MRALPFAEWMRLVCCEYGVLRRALNALHLTHQRLSLLFPPVLLAVERTTTLERAPTVLSPAPTAINPSRTSLVPAGPEEDAPTAQRPVPPISPPVTSAQVPSDACTRLIADCALVIADACEQAHVRCAKLIEVRCKDGLDETIPVAR